ncbi:MAG: NADP-dependent oxidoreductase [Bacteroidales bacterium]|jgi:NADPH:quinone reductase-like Zn-dependent oxidoreductase|nr:NADP-dependent oxidoreductase [Bacteroidales bacterium]
MKAAIISQFGDPDVFKIEDIEKPIVNSDQVLINVNAVSVNPIDWKQRKGNHKYILGSPFPIILGYDVSGVVEEIGSEISKFNKGDIVFGVLDNKYGGALAEFAVGHEKCFTLKPEKISFENAAAVPMVSLTCLQAFRDKVNLNAGQTVLINGASGGVGHVAIQIAQIMGAKVIAVASSKSKEFVEQFKPDSFVDYTENNILKLDKKVDVFFDVAGKYSFPKTKHLLNPGGIYLNPNYINSIIKMPFNKFYQLFSNGKKAKTFMMKHNNSDLDIIAQWIDEGKLKIFIDKTFDLEQITEAHEYSQKGHNKGKNIIVIANTPQDM